MGFSPFYNDVGFVKAHFDRRLWRAGSGVKGGPAVFAGPFISTLDSADGSPQWEQDEDFVKKVFVLSEIFLRCVTKTRLSFNPAMALSATNHLFGSAP